MKLTSVFDLYFDQVEILREQSTDKKKKPHMAHQTPGMTNLAELDDSLNQQVFMYTVQTQNIFVEVLGSFVQG